MTGRNPQPTMTRDLERKGTIMTVHFTRRATTALAFIFMAQTASADLMAQDVWADWKSYLSGMGYDITAKENMSGDTLTLSDIEVKLAMPQETGTGSGVIESISLRENSDGTVNIVFPNPHRISFSFSDPEAGSGEGVLEVTHDGLIATVSGDPMNLHYEYSFDMVNLALANLVIDGEAPKGDFVFEVIGRDGKGISDMKVGSMRDVEQDYSMQSLDVNFSFIEPESGNNGNLRANIAGLAGTGSSTLPKQMDPTDLTGMLASGMKGSGTFSYDKATASLGGKADGSGFASEMTSDGGELTAMMDGEHLSYVASGKASTLHTTTDQLPFPVDVSFGYTGFKLDVPFAQSEEPQDFAFGLTLGELAVSEMVWGLFDPTGTLPHDPATLELDVDGKAKVDVNIFDPEQAEAMAMSDTPPGELHALNINKLLLSMVGARLSGDGAFTFDNSDLESFGGVPRPEGKLNLQLAGANTLIDKLIQMGFVSDQDAMGARMMMGMFGVPGSEPDTINSTIEINAEGHVTANGQRIK